MITINISQLIIITMAPKVIHVHVETVDTRLYDTKLELKMLVLERTVAAKNFVVEMLRHTLRQHQRWQQRNQVLQRAAPSWWLARGQECSLKANIRFLFSPC